MIFSPFLSSYFPSVMERSGVLSVLWEELKSSA